MKKKKGLIAAIVAAVALGIGGITVFATNTIAKSNAIPEDTARNFAYVDAGVAPEDVTVTRTEFDYENGQFVYEIEFYTAEKEFDYVVNATNGKILQREYELLPMKQNSAAKQATSVTPVPTTDPAKTQASLIGLERAKELALKDAGLSASDVTFSKAKQDRDDGLIVYEIDFYINGQAEYEYEIEAESGRIRTRSKEVWDAEGAMEAGVQEALQTQPSEQTQQVEAAPAQSTPKQAEAAPTQAPAQQATPAPTQAPAQQATPAPTQAPKQQAAPAPVYDDDDDDDWDDRYDDHDDYDDDRDDWDDNDD